MKCLSMGTPNGAYGEGFRSNVKEDIFPAIDKRESTSKVHSEKRGWEKRWERECLEKDILEIDLMMFGLTF